MDRAGGGAKSYQVFEEPVGLLHHVSQQPAGRQWNHHHLEAEEQQEEQGTGGGAGGEGQSHGSCNSAWLWVLVLVLLKEIKDSALTLVFSGFMCARVQVCSGSPGQSGPITGF